MKKILITGVNSYVGRSFKNWVENFQDRYLIDTITLRNDTWKQKDFSYYDVVLHVAGIAHVSSDPKMEDLYYKVNRDLTIEVATKAKKEGVKQFIFLSSIIVYGDSSPDYKVIKYNTPPNPSNFYGNSKLQAENGLKLLESERFRIVILRPPMIYGQGSKGNYALLSKISKKLLIFPDIDNKRSMIHIDNLCEFIRLLIENEERGMFFPQNKEYVKTSIMVKFINEVHGKNIRLTKFFNPLLKLIGYKIELFSKVFGNLVYDKNLSIYKDNYQIRNFKESIIATELEKTDE